jgi:molybdenum cofactor cytidylyltransferase
MPKLETATVDALIDTFDDTVGRSICLPVQEGRRGNPVLFSHTHFSSLSTLTGDRGGKAVVQANPDAVTEVAVADPGIHLDFDNP